MLSLIEEMTGLERLFVTCAAFGTILFIVRLVMMFLGTGADEGADAGGIDQADVQDVSADFSDSDLSFKALSLQGITAFFMMFGLVGWALVRQGNLHPALSVSGGTVAGLATVWIMKKIFQWAGSLQSSGNIDLQNAVGQEGRVYLTIRPGQTGKVQIAVQGRLSVLNAAAAGNEELKTGQSVRVVRISADTLVVEKT